MLGSKVTEHLCFLNDLGPLIFVKMLGKCSSLCDMK